MSTLSGPELHEYMTRVRAREQTPRHLPPVLSTLEELQLAHVKGIPFENLSLHHPKAVQNNEFISSDLSNVFEKLIRKPRGGYCFEQNTLFAAVLRSLGYDVYTAAARVVQEHDEHKHELKLTGTEHMVIIVSFGDGSIWLTDVGFGGQVARRPLRIDQIELDPPQDSRTYGYKHRLRPGLMGSSLEVPADDIQRNSHTSGYYLQCTDSKRCWKDLYFFHLKACSEKDHEIYNWWCATSPSAPMRNMPIAAIQTEHGRITYNGKTIKVFESTQAGDKVSEQIEVDSLGSKQADQQLKEKFGIQFPQGLSRP